VTFSNVSFCNSYNACICFPCLNSKFSYDRLSGLEAVVPVEVVPVGVVPVGVVLAGVVLVLGLREISS
jgi:hypothetical protein